MVKKIAPTGFFPKPQMKTNDFAIYYNLDKVQEEVDDHHHDYFEFYFFVSGRVKFYIQDKEISLKSGDILLIPPGQNHYARIARAPYERYVLWLSRHYLQRLSSPKTNLMIAFEKINFLGYYLLFTEELQVMVNSLLKLILFHSQSQEYGSDLLVSSYVIELLINIAKTKLYQQPVLLARDFDNNSVLLRALEYIDEHVGGDLQAEELARALFVSPSYIARIFRQSMGISLHQYIIQKRLYLAQQELISGAPIELISHKYGFGNYSSFYRAFRKEMGIGPRAFVQAMVSNDVSQKS